MVIASSHNSTFKMKILWSLGLYVFFRNCTFCAGELQSLRMTTRRSILKECQNCLLRHLSVVHMEEMIWSDRSDGKFVEYWVVGGSFLRENSIICLEPYKCEAIKFSNVKRGFPSHDISLHGSTFAPFIVPIEYLSNSELQARATKNLVVIDRAEFSRVREMVDPPCLAPRIQQNPHQCIFEYDQSIKDE